SSWLDAFGESRFGLVKNDPGKNKATQRPGNRIEQPVRIRSAIQHHHVIDRFQNGPNRVQEDHSTPLAKHSGIVKNRSKENAERNDDLNNVFDVQKKQRGARQKQGPSRCQQNQQQQQQRQPQYLDSHAQATKRHEDHH